MKLWIKGVICLAILGVSAYVTSPLWISWLPVPPPPVAQVVPLVKVTDVNTDAAFSPAGATCKMYDPHGLTSMPTYDVAPFTFLDTLTEGPDGEWTGTKTVDVGTWVYLYVADSALGWYTKGVFCKIPPARVGTTGESNAIDIRMTPTDYSATAGECNTLNLYGAAVSMMLTTSGAAVTNSTNIATGLKTYRLDITATSAYGFGSEGYVDPATGYYYRGGFVVLDLDVTTARGTLASASIYDHFVIGVHEYWVLGFNQVRNDADVTTDGTVSIYFDLDNQAAAADVADFCLYPYARPSYIHAASFGLNCENDNLRLIHYA